MTEEEETPRTTLESLMRISTAPNAFTVVEIIPPPDHFQNEESPSGAYISTPGARRFPPEEVHEALRRFSQKDWGELAAQDDHRRNDHNIRTREGTVLASYGQDGPIDRIWIHLGRHAQNPTVMVPEEY